MGDRHGIKAKEKDPKFHMVELTELDPRTGNGTTHFKAEYQGQEITGKATIKAGQVSNIKWEEQKVRYDKEHNRPESDIKWDEKEISYNESEAARRAYYREGDPAMVVTADMCSPNEDFVAGHKSTYNGKEIHVHSYCRIKTDKETAKDKADESAAGKRNGPKAKNWENKPKNKKKKQKTGKW